MYSLVFRHWMPMPSMRWVTFVGKHLLSMTKLSNVNKKRLCLCLVGVLKHEKSHRNVVFRDITMTDCVINGCFPIVLLDTVACGLDGVFRRFSRVPCVDKPMERALSWP